MKKLSKFVLYSVLATLGFLFTSAIIRSGLDKISRDGRLYLRKEDYLYSADAGKIRYLFGGLAPTEN